jgi:hypothetical protein
MDEKKHLDRTRRPLNVRKNVGKGFLVPTTYILILIFFLFDFPPLSCIFIPLSRIPSHAYILSPIPSLSPYIFLLKP